MGRCCLELTKEKDGCMDVTHMVVRVTHSLGWIVSVRCCCLGKYMDRWYVDDMWVSPYCNTDTWPTTGLVARWRVLAMGIGWSGWCMHVYVGWLYNLVAGDGHLEAQCGMDTLALVRLLWWRGLLLDACFKLLIIFNLDSWQIVLQAPVPLTLIGCICFGTHFSKKMTTWSPGSMLRDSQFPWEMIEPVLLFNKYAILKGIYWQVR